MIEDDPKLEPRNEAGADHYGEALLYDLGKFLTTLSLLALGGVLTIADTADPADVKRGNIILISVVLAAAAALAASIATTIAYSRATGKPSRYNLPTLVMITMGLLGMGLGMFIFMWIDKLS